MKRAIPHAIDVVVPITWPDIVWVDELDKVETSEETTRCAAITVINWAICHRNVWKRDEGNRYHVKLILYPDINVALPVVNVLVVVEWCSALNDTGCSRSFISAEQCRLWTAKHAYVETVGGRMRMLCDVGPLLPAQTVAIQPRLMCL